MKNPIQITNIKQALTQYFTELSQLTKHDNNNHFVLRNTHNSELLLSDGSQIHTINWELNEYLENDDHAHHLYDILGQTDISNQIYTILYKELYSETPTNIPEQDTISFCLSNHHDITILFTYTDLNFLFSIHHYEQ